jgi:O-antigen ligase
MGLALLLLWIAWSAFAAAFAGLALSPRSPYVVAPLMLSVGIALGRFVSRRSDNWVTPIALLGLTILLLVAVLTTAGPAKGFTGYANANAAFAVQLMGLSGLALLRATGRRRAILAAATVAAAAATLANRSLAGAGLGAALLAVVMVMVWRPARRARWRVMAGGTGGAAILVAAAMAGWLAQQSSWQTWISATLDEARHTLWRDALDLWSAHPLTGAGPGAYERLSTLGRDPDTAAAHSAVLQVGAETGWIGVTLFLLLALAGLFWATRGEPAYAVVRAATWTALVVHSCFDHVVDFPFLVMVSGTVLGWSAVVDGSGHLDGSEQLDVAEGESPGRR